MADIFSIFDPFWVIFGHFGSKVPILWVRDLGGRGTQPPNLNMGFVCGTQGPHRYWVGPGPAGVSLGYILGRAVMKKPRGYNLEVITWLCITSGAPQITKVPCLKIVRGGIRNPDVDCSSHGSHR